MKRFALKRITALVLALIMTLSLCPVSAWAEVLESAPVYEFSGSYVAEDDGVSNEEAFAAYFQRELDASLGYETPSFYSTSALKEGTLEKEVYDLVKAELTKIAEGTATSADIRVYPTKGWSTEDLGVPELSSGNGLSAEADAAITAKLNLVYNCLLADCPMELYWHDKTLSASFGMSGISISEENSLQTMKPNMVSYTFIVATDYRDNADVNHVTTDASITGATSAAINNAEAIVSANAAKSDFEKLKAYKDAICALVSYNDEAAASTSTTDGINPWQMIWVFDEDSATEVVCEGYAKAFQYLCDLSTFSGDVECHTVSGTMSGGTGAGRHMWNVVTMDDGENYLVDVTNCDTGTIGADGELFMASTTNSANSNQTHTFTIGGEDIVFTYDGAMSDLFCDGYLAISETAYVEPVQGYVPLYWSDDNGATYHNGIDEPYEQPLYNDGRMASLFVKSGDMYVALDEATFGNETITKLSEDIGFFGWVEGRNRVFWNTEGAVEGTESGAVFTVGQTQYLINLKVRVSTTEELAEGFAKNYLYDYTAQEYYTTATFDNAWKLCNAKLSFDALSAERQAAVLNIVPDAGDMLAAGQFIYWVLDGHKYNGQHFVEITDSTSDRDVAEFLGGYGTWNTLTAAQKTMVNDALKAIGGQYTVEQMYEAAAERNSEEARWFPAGTSGWEGRGTLVEAVEYANSLTDGTALIQLLSDVKTDTPLVFNSDTKTILDLNGHTIDRGLTEAVEGGNVITVYGDLQLNDDSTTDVTKQGKITGGYTADPVNNVGGGPGGVKVMGSFTMTGGNITGNKGTAGGVQVLSGFFTMFGGAITNNEASYTGMGGGVYVNNGSMFEMVGGEISGNVADGKEEGTTVYGGLGGGVWNGGEFIMRGGKITGNTAMYGAGVKGSLYVSDSPVITGNISNLNNQQQANNVHLFSGETAYILGALTTEASIGVTTGTMPTATNPVTVALGRNYTVTASDAAAFFGDAGFDVILTNGGSVQLTPSSQVVPGSTLSGEFVNGEVGVAIFTDLDENGVLGVDAPIYGYGGVVAASDVIACGKQSQQIYLAVGANQTLSVKQDNQQISITNIGTWTPSWGPAGADTPHDVYVLEATKTGNEDVSVYTVTRENESFTLTVDFSPAYNNSGNKQVGARGVHVFTDLDTANNTLSCDDSVVQFGNQNEAYVYFTCGNAASRTVYLAAEQWDTLSVTDANGDPVSLSKMGMWPTQYTDQNGNPFDVTCNVYALEATGNSGIAEYTATRSWSYWLDHDGDPNTADQLVNESEDVTLKFDFYPTITGTLRNAERGVAIFTKLNNNTLGYTSNVSGGQNGATVNATGLTTQTMYLAVGVHDKVIVNDGTKDIALTRVGTWTDTDGMMSGTWAYEVYTFDVAGNGGAVEYAVTRTGFDGGNREDFTLTVDFSPVFTNDENRLIGARGVFLFTEKNGTEFSCDTSSVAQWGDPSGEYLYLTCGDVTSRTVYLAVNQWDTLSVSGFATLPKVGTWVATFTDENGDPFQQTCNVYELTVDKPATGKTADYTVTRSWTWHDDSGTAHDESEYFTLTFDFAPTLRGNIEMGASNIVFFNELNGTELICDTSSATQWGDADGQYVYFAYGDTADDQTMYLATSPRDKIAVKNGTANVSYTHVGTTTFKTREGNDWLCKVYEVPVPAPTSGKSVEYTVEHEWTYWENNQPVSQREDVFFTFDFTPALTGEIEMAMENIPLFTDLNGTELICDTSSIAQWGNADGDHLYLIYDGANTDQKVYLATHPNGELTVKNGTANVPYTYVGTATFKAGDGSDWLCKVYEVPVNVPATTDGAVVEYTVTRTWTWWDENNQPVIRNDESPLIFDFSALLKGDLRNMECGVAIFSTLKDGVLGGDNSIIGLRGSAVVASEGSNQKTVFLAEALGEKLTVNDSQQDLEYVGLWAFDGWYFKVYALTVDMPTSGDTVEFDVARSWDRWDNNGTPDKWDDDFFVPESESFPLTFDFTLSPGEMPPLTVDGVKIYSYCQNGDLGYRVTYVYDELGVNDDTNTVTVPCRPNQDKTIYLASDKPLYLNGIELPKCTNPATEYGKTVYELTAEGVNLGPSTAVVNIGDTGNTITVRFTFHSVMFIGTSFYTTTDENFGGYFTYEDRTTCDGLSVEWLDIGNESHFYLNVPFAVGKEKVLYINPEDGNIATVVAAEGSIDTQHYSFELIEDSTGTSGYSKYYKLTLSDELNETKNLMFRLQNENGEEIGASIDVIFRPTEDSFEACWNLADSAETPVRGSLKQAMTYANGLAEGTAYIQLIKDVNTDEPLVFAKGATTILDLNGHTIDRGLSDATEAAEDGNVITVKGKLVLCDNSTTDVTKQGKITGGYGAFFGGGIYVDYTGELVMNSGVITGNIAESSGGGVCVASGKFTMAGGIISENKAVAGGGVYASGGILPDDTFLPGIFTMIAGTISNNTAAKAYDETEGNYFAGCGGGVYLEGSELHLRDGIISGNTATDFGGGVDLNSFYWSDSSNNDHEEKSKFQILNAPYISGNTVGSAANNVELSDGETITVNSLVSGAKIGVTKWEAGVFTSGGANYVDSGYFTSDCDDFMIVGDGSDLMLAVKRTVSFNANNGTDQTAKPFEVADGRKFKLPERPENTITAPAGMQFKGWSYSADGAVITDSTITVTSDIVLYAIWENIPAEVPVVEVSADLSLTYGEYSDQKVSVAVTKQPGYSYTYQWYDADDNAIAMSDSYAISNNLTVGKYSYYCVVTATREDNKETAFVTSETITVTVAKAVPSVSAPAGLTATYGETLADVALPMADNGKWSWKEADTTSVGNAGDNTFTLVFTPNDLDNYEIAEVEAKVAVAKKQVAVPEKDTTYFEYDGKVQTYDVAVSDLYTVTGTTRTEAGSQNVTITLKDKANYEWNNDNPTDDLVFDFAIARRMITVTADAATKTFGEADPALTYTVDRLVEDETLKGDLERVAGEDAGTYAIEQGTLTAANNPNYNITYKEAEFTITKADATVTAPVAKTDLKYTGVAQALITAGSTSSGALQYSLDDQTYSTDIPTGTDAKTYTVYYKVEGDANHNDVAAESVTVTIAKAAVTVTADNKSKVYGESDPALTYSASGLVGEEKLSDISVTRVSGETVGEYVITATQTDGANSNYEIIFVNGTFTITAKTSVPTIELSAETFTYDGTAKNPTVTVKDGENVIPTSEYTVVYSDNINAGTAKVTITDVAGGNYVVNGSKSFTIAKAPLTITANAKAITYGDAPTNAGVSYTGFVNGETEDKLTGTLSYSYDYKQYGNVGTYAITPAGLSSNNYAITFVNGALTVGQKEIGIEWGSTDLTYSGKAQAPTATATGMVNGDEVTLTVSGEKINIGSYTATVTGLVGDKAGNYKLPANVTAAFTVDYATVTFNTNGAGTIEAIENLTYGNKITEPSKPEKAKHTFAGWFSDEKCTKLWVFDKDTITGDMTLYAKWSENPVYDVSGIVYEQPGNDEHSQKVANAHVQLMLGTTVVVEQTTNGNGQFFFGGQEEGDYNLVVTHRHNNSKHDKVVTVLVALHEHNADDIEVVLPKHVTNSKVEHKNNNPEVEGEPDTGIATGTLVGGLDVVAETMRKKEEQKVDTSSGNVEASEAVAKVEVTLTVEDTPPVTNPTTEEEKKVQKEQVAIQQKAPGKEVVFFDLSVLMSVTDNNDQTTESRISDTGSLLEIRIPFEKGNKSGITIYRYHGDQAEALPEVNEGSQTEGFWVGDDGYIHIYTHKFSTYAVGYTEPGNNTGGTPGGYYPIVTPTTPVEKPEDTTPTETKPVVTPTTPVEDDVTPAPEDTTPVVPDAPATDDAPAVDNTPADDMTPSDSGNSVGLWIGVALAVLVVAIIVVVILIKRKKA